MYFESDAYPELVHSSVAEQLRERWQEEQQRQARRARRARRVARVRALLATRRA